MTCSVLIPAAGRGERLGKGPKAMVRLSGKTLLERVVAFFAPISEEVIVAISPEMQSKTEETIAGYANVRWVLGGETRQESVYSAVQSAVSDLVLVHDCARPFLYEHLVHDLRVSAEAFGAATLALACSDTLIHTEDSRWMGLLDRSKTRAVQTPQAFHRDLLLEAHTAARNFGWPSTDDASLIVRLGRPVYCVPGDSRLFKITTPEDLALAEAFCTVWDQQVI